MSWKDLPFYKGLPVPWAARWTGEKARALASLKVNPFDLTAAFPVVSFSGQESIRDDWGVLWQPDIDDIGNGEPEFGEVNTIRQVKAMREGRCQVCGDKIIDPDVWLFLMAEVEYRATMAAVGTGKSKFTTSTPPVCEECHAVAIGKCPVLQQGNRTVRAKSYTPVNVWGIVYMLDATSATGWKERAHDVPLGHAALQGTIGKQLVVRLELE